MRTAKFMLALILSVPLTAVSQTDTSKTLVIVAGQDAALAYNKGITEANSGDFIQAEASFSSALGYNASFAKAYYNRGLMELKLADNSTALDNFDRAVSYTPERPQYYLGRAIALARQGSYGDAISAVKKAESRGYNRSQVKYYYGYIYALQGSYSQAIQSYTEAINSNKKYAYAYCDRGTVQLLQGNVKAALDDYNTAAEIMPNAGFIYVLRADAKAAQGNFTAAINDINTALSIDGEDDMAWLNARGIMYGRAKKTKLAMADFNRCKTLYPDSPAADINIGNMLMDQKKYAEAEASYTKAIAIDSQNFAAYNNRANAREFQFNIKGADDDRAVAKTLK